MRIQNIRTAWQYFTGSKGLIITSALLLAVAGGLAGLAITQRSNAASCDKVNVIYCGVSGTEDFKKVYASNKSGHAASPTVKKDYTDLHKVFNDMGISDATIASMNSTNTKMGTVYRDGTVKIGNQVVGTDALVAARFKTPETKGVIAGTNVYVRAVTESFVKPSRSALVYMKDGKMKFAVIVECGNAVLATPKEQPKPKPQPKPQPKPPAKTVTPIKKCEYLHMTKKVDRTTFEFEAKGSASGGAEITGYTFDFGDKQTQTIPTSNTVVTTNHRYSEVKDYTVTVNVLVSTNGGTSQAVSGKNCSVVVTPTTQQTPPSTPPEETPQETPAPETPAEEELPSTGTGAVIAGFAGFTSLTGAAGYYIASRRNLIRNLLQH